MMKALDPALMRRIEDECDRMGVSRLLLMENAGCAVARYVRRRVGRGSVLIVAGTGNNGGDGFVAARHAAGLGADVTVILIGDPNRIRTAEAKRNFEIIRSMRESVKLHIVEEIGDLDQIRDQVESADVVVDAIFGTGIRGAIREPWRSAIQLINSVKALKISVDVPSGVNPDTGEITDLAVNANITVTFHRPKLGMPAAADYCGEVVIAPIGIPPEAEIVMGPGNARQALRSARDEILDVILLDDLDDRVIKLLSALGVQHRVGGAVQEKVVYLGKRLDLGKSISGASGVLALGLINGSPLTASIIDLGEARQRLGIDFEDHFIEKHGILTRKASEVEGAIYILGKKSDLLIGGSRWQMSWVNRPLNEEGAAALTAITLFLMARGIKPFNALSAAGYFAGFAAQHGIDQLTKELERLSGKR